MARQGNIRMATASASATLFLAPRRNRVSLTLFPSASDYTINTDPNVTATNGIVVKAFTNLTTTPIVLDAAVVGDVVAQALYMFSMGSAQFAFIETVEGS